MENLAGKKIQPRPNFSKAMKFSNTINPMTWNTFRNCTQMCKNILVFFSVISFIPNHKCLSAVEMNKIRPKCCKNCNTGTCRSNFFAPECFPLSIWNAIFVLIFIFYSISGLCRKTYTRTIFQQSCNSATKRELSLQRMHTHFTSIFATCMQCAQCFHHWS